MRSILIALAAMLLAGNALADASSRAVQAGESAYERGDFEAAADHWRRAAQADHAQAEFRLGTLYDEGLGVPEDAARAAEWYRRAAEHGSEKAQFNLAHMYARGRGVEQDEAEAARWYRRAAERGNAHAQYTLGLILYRGRAVERDLPAAYVWLTIASENFSANQFRDNANEVRHAIAREMTDEQQAAAERELQRQAAARD